MSTGSPPTVFLFIGIIVLALSVIALAVWVSVLSSRIKKLSDRIMYDANAPRHPQTGQMTSAPRGIPEQQAAMTQQFDPVGGYPQYSAHMTPMNPREAMQPTATSRPYDTMMGAQPGLQNIQGGQTVRSIQPAVSRVHAGAVQPMEVEDDGQAFFDGYRDRLQSDASQTGAFRREKPTIPFGADKNEASRRESYTQDAVSGEYDPDSIDFSRVAGYKNIRY